MFNEKKRIGYSSPPQFFFARFSLRETDLFDFTKLFQVKQALSSDCKERVAGWSFQCGGLPMFDFTVCQ